MAKQKIDQLTVSYDKDADVLYITEGKPRESIGEMMDDGIIVRRDAKTKAVMISLKEFPLKRIFHPCRLLEKIP